MFNPDWHSRMLHSIFWMLKHGISVFPIGPASKHPADPASWPTLASNNINDIPRLFPGGRNHNVAIRLCQETDLLDLEPDDEEAVELVERLIAVTGVRTMAYRSSKGIHRLFRWNAELGAIAWHGGRPRSGELECRNAAIGKNLYSVCPFSLHADRKVWIDWLPGCAPWEIGVQPLPQNIVDHFIQFGKRKGDGKTIPVQQVDDGYLPQEGHRHEANLAMGKTLFCEARLPMETCVEMLRVFSQHTGSYEEHGRGETEIVNALNKLTRSPLPDEEMQVDWVAVDESASEAFRQAKYPATAKYAIEMPSTIFPPMIQEMSIHAGKTRAPRNMFGMTLLSVCAAALGAGVKIRVSKDHRPLPPSLYCLGVGKSGSGKSKVLNPLLEPFSGSGQIVTDTTPEALIAGFVRHPRGILMPLAEGRNFAGMFNRYSPAGGGGGGGSSLFHEAWSCDSISVFRKSGNLEIPAPHLCVIAGIQKIHLAKFPPEDAVDGLLQRMLVFHLGPVTKKEDRAAVKAMREFEPVFAKLIERLRSIKVSCGIPSLMSILEAAHQKISALDLILTDEAREVYYRYDDMKRSDQTTCQWEEEHPYQSDVLRHAEYALRISGVLEMITLAIDEFWWNRVNINALTEYPISVNSITQAIKLVEWSWSHKQDLCEGIVEAAYGRATNNFGLEKLQSIPDKLELFAAGRSRRMSRSGADAWTLRDYYRVIGIEKAKAQDELNLLMTSGYVLPLPGESRIKRYQFKETT